MRVIDSDDEIRKGDEVPPGDGATPSRRFRFARWFIGNIILFLILAFIGGWLGHLFYDVARLGWEIWGETLR